MKLQISGGIFVLASVGMFSVWEGAMVIHGLCFVAFGLLLAVIGAFKKEPAER